MENEIEKFINKQGALVALVFIIVGFLVLIFSIFGKPFNDWSFFPDPLMFGQFGDFIGGFVGTIFTLGGFILIYKTFIAQRETINLQKKTFLSERNDNLYFNLLSSQQNITDKIKAHIHTLNSISKEVVFSIEGRDFFLYSKTELIKIWSSLNSNEYFEYNERDVYYAEHEIDDLYDPANVISYDPEEASYQEQIIRKNIDLSYTNKIYGISKGHWKKFKDKPMPLKLQSMYAFYFSKFHYIAGHYFRHLYHILNFVEQVEYDLFKGAKSDAEQIEIKGIIKKYVDFLQSQMSSFELMLLFYNSSLFPKALTLVKKYNVLENLAVEDLIDQSHNCIDGIILKKRNLLLGIDEIMD